MSMNAPEDTAANLFERSAEAGIPPDRFHPVLCWCEITDSRRFWHHKPTLAGLRSQDGNEPYFTIAP